MEFLLEVVIIFGLGMCQSPRHAQRFVKLHTVKPFRDSKVPSNTVSISLQPLLYHLILPFSCGQFSQSVNMDFVI